MLQNLQYWLTNVIFKKVQRTLENVMAGIFVPLGSGLATPSLSPGSIKVNPLPPLFTSRNLTFLASDVTSNECIAGNG